MKIVLTGLLILASTFAIAQESLASWNEGKNKTNVMQYVKAVTDKNSADFIPVKDRIAVFDNDGTLWAEQPMYFQLFFAIDRIKSLAPNHPKWKTIEPFKSLLENDIKGMLKSGKKGLLEIVNASHTGIDVEIFEKEVKSWLKLAKHPSKNHSFDRLIFQPMMELISYLKVNHFKVYIASAGGVDFMRSFIPEVYGIPKDHIIGSRMKVHYANGNIIKDAGIGFIDDHASKPVAIYNHIGKRPIAAFGNSDGDLEMLQYTQSNKKYKTLQLYVHHTDEDREWKYDRKSLEGKLDKGLDYALKNNWTIVDMKKEWKVIYPFELKN